MLIWALQRSQCFKIRVAQHWGGRWHITVRTKVCGVNLKNFLENSREAVSVSTIFSLFHSSLMLLQPHKPALAEAIWALTMESSDVTVPQGELQFFLDSCVRIHRIPWPRGSTYRNICAFYCNYVDQKYGKAIIIFDGDTSTSTKSMTKQRRAGGKVGATVTFADDMKLTMKKDHFMANKRNKQSFINQYA